MIHFHPLTIKEINQETDDCVSVVFEIPDALKSTFRFNQGQSLTMRTHLNGEEIRRTYSICSSPFDDEWRVAIKKVDGGLFSTHANEQLKKGDVIEVMPPVGKFYTELDPRHKKNYVAFVAGSGITPVLSIIKTTLRTEPGSSFTLVYGNRNKNSIIFKEELEALKDKYIDRFRIYHILSRERTDVPLNEGRIDAQKMELFFNKLIHIESCDEFFLCGPEEMIFTAKEFLEKHNVPANKIHFELFTIPGVKQSTIKTVIKNELDEGPQATVSVKVDGILFDFKLGYESNSILDAALKEGADLPFACKGGVCCTCKAKLLEGEVKMDVNWGLEPDEVEDGFILTCQSHPTTDRVVVDFDVK